MFYNFPVDIPKDKGKISFQKQKDTVYVENTYDRIEDLEKKYNYAKRITIGKQCGDDPYSTENTESCDVYLLEAATVRLIPDAFWKRIMPARYERALRYRHEEDRYRCLAAGLLLSGLLFPQSEAALKTGVLGKPYLPGEMQFSLSHGGRYAVLALDEQPVGVDIEPVDPSNLSAASMVFTPDEYAWVQKDPLLRFHMLWTRKESVMKATGLGLHLAPHSFSVLPADMEDGQTVSSDTTAGAIASCRILGTDWHLASTAYKDCMLSCAVGTPIKRLCVVEMDALTLKNRIEQNERKKD